jgi:hypothetical protein
MWISCQVGSLAPISINVRSNGPSLSRRQIVQRDRQRREAAWAASRATV